MKYHSSLRYALPFLFILASSLPAQGETFLTADGNTPLTGNWNAGAFQITANGVQLGAGGPNLSWAADAGGNIGSLGANRPSNAYMANLLNVGSASNFGKIILNDSSSAYSLYVAGQTPANAAFYSYGLPFGGITVGQARGSASSPSATLHGDVAGFIVFAGYTGSGSIPLSRTDGFAASIQSTATENWSTTASGVDLDFQLTKTGTNTRYSAMHLKNTGDLALQAAGAGFQIKEGANAKMGTAMLPGGAPHNSVVVSTAAVTSTSRIILTCNDPNGGRPSNEWVAARAPGTSFTIEADSPVDTCVIAWIIFDPS